MPLNLQEVGFSQVVEWSIGGAKVLATFDNRADAVERAISEKQQRPSAGITVIETTYVNVLSA